MELSAVVLNVDGSGEGAAILQGCRMDWSDLFFDPGVAAWPQQRRTVVAIIHVLA